MKDMRKDKVASIVPALNEEKTVANVLKTLLKSEEIDQVILVDNGSEDKTAEIGEQLGVKLIRARDKKGKGEAMRKGVENTEAQIIVFFDADLIGLKNEHIKKLVEPVLKDKAAMSVGLIKGRLVGMPGLMAKIDDLAAIAGQRAMKRSVFENTPFRFIKGFGVETALNYYCQKNKLVVELVALRGLKVVIKEKKWGFFKGFLNRLKMFWDLFKIRVLILIYNQEFKQNV
jgi:glycosyltransferase involved in cell wall biosynthesis